MSNLMSIVGTIATEPRLVPTNSGAQLCTFRVASTDRRYNRATQKWEDGETNWFTVAAFRGLAGHVLASLRKGERVIVQGRLRVRRWERDGRAGTSVEIDAEALGHDLRWGVSRFSRMTAPSGASASGSSGEEAEQAATPSELGAPTHPQAGAAEAAETVGAVGAVGAAESIAPFERRLADAPRPSWGDSGLVALAGADSAGDDAEASDLEEFAAGGIEAEATETGSLDTGGIETAESVTVGADEADDDRDAQGFMPAAA